MVHLGYLSLPMNRLACGAVCSYIACLCLVSLTFPGIVIRVVPIVNDVFSSTPLGLMNFIVGVYLLIVAIYNMNVRLKLPAPAVGTQLYWKPIPELPLIHYNPLTKLFRLLINPPDIYIISFALIVHVGVITCCYYHALPLYPDSPPADVILLVITVCALVVWLCAIWHEEEERRYIFDQKVTWSDFLSEVFDVLSKRSIANIIILLNGIILAPLTGYSLLKTLDEKTSAYAKYLSQTEDDEHLPIAFLIFAMLFALRSSYNIAKEGFIAASESLRSRILLKERYNLTALSVLLNSEYIYSETISDVVKDINSKYQDKSQRFDNDLIDYFRSDEEEKPLPLISAKWYPDTLYWHPKPIPKEQKTTPVAGTSNKAEGSGKEAEAHVDQEAAVSGQDAEPHADQKAAESVEDSESLREQRVEETGKDAESIMDQEGEKSRKGAESDADASVVLLEGAESHVVAAAKWSGAQFQHYRARRSESPDKEVKSAGPKLRDRSKLGKGKNKEEKQQPKTPKSKKTENPEIRKVTSSLKKVRICDDGPAKGPAKGLAKSPAKGSAETPAKGSAESPTKASAKSPSKSPSKSPAKSPSKSPGKSPGKSPSKSPGKSPSSKTRDFHEEKKAG